MADLVLSLSMCELAGDPDKSLNRGSTQNLNLLPTGLDDNIDFYQRLIQMVPIEPWQNSTSFMVQQPSVRQKLTILEDDLKDKNEPKNEDDLKILTTRKVTQNPKYCDTFFTFVTLILTKSPNF